MGRRQKSQPQRDAGPRKEQSEDQLQDLEQPPQQPPQLLQRQQAPERPELDPEDQEDLNRQHRHSVFKDNIPRQYDQFLQYSPPVPGWECSSVDFLPGWDDEEDGWGTQMVLLGRGTNLDVLQLKLLLPRARQDPQHNPLEEFYERHFRLEGSYVHPAGRVDRVRHMPQDHSKVATKSNGNGLFLFDIDFTLQPGTDGGEEGQEGEGEGQEGEDEGESEGEGEGNQGEGAGMEEGDGEESSETLGEEEEEEEEEGEEEGEEKDAGDDDMDVDQEQQGQGNRQEGKGMQKQQGQQQQQQQGQEMERPGPVAVLGSGEAHATPAGIGLCWHPCMEGVLYSTCVGGAIQQVTLGAVLLEPPQDSGAAALTGVPRIGHSQMFTGGHEGAVNDVAVPPAGWALGPNTFASAGSDGKVVFWDTREGRAVARQRVHRGAANSLAFSYHDPWMVVSGGDDSRLCALDLRMSPAQGAEAAGVMASPYTVYPQHQCPVLHVSCSPQHPGLVASGDDDGRVFVWDLKKTQKRLPRIAKCLPPQVRFIHPGHGERVSDVGWSRSDGPPLLASCSLARKPQPSVVQAWCPAADILTGGRPWPTDQDEEP